MSLYLFFIPKSEQSLGILNFMTESTEISYNESYSSGMRLNFCRFVDLKNEYNC